MKLTGSQVSDIMYEGGVYDENDNELFSVVYEEIVSIDQEKNSSEIEYVIEEHSTGKFFRSYLGKSPWCRQAEHNADQKWTEVKAKKITTTIYE